MTHPKVIFEPHARRFLRAGFNQLSDLISVTLGPYGRTVAVSGDNPRRAPEILNDGAVLARRFLGLPNRFETMGAFLARHIAWQVEESVGDGSTTAVVIAREIINESERYIAGGYNAMLIRNGIEKTVPVLLDEIHRMAAPLDEPERIVALARAITGDLELANLIEEIFDVVGPLGAIDVRNSYARSHEREYIRGAFWNQGWASSYFATEPGKAVVDDPFLLLTSCHLERADELLPVMERIRNANSRRGLVVIASGIKGEALNLLVTNNAKKSLSTLAIKAPGLGSEKSEILQDLATLCGGRAFLTEAGDEPATATIDELGEADQVHAILSGFTVIGGKGRPAAVRERVNKLRKELSQATYGRERNRLLERSSKLTGGVALLKIGGATDLERDYVKDRAKEAVHTIRLALEDGVLPGGGAAYLDCLPALNYCELQGDEAAAIPIMRRALQAPMRTILDNAGLEPSPILDRVAEAGPGTAFDIVAGKMTNMMADNVVDAARVLSQALKIGVSGALMAITTDVLVSKPRSNRSDEVDFNV